MPINLKQLQNVVLLADELHFGRAAERAFLSTSAFSRSIAAMETGVSMRLFDRRPGRVQLTVAGERVIARARRLLLSSQDLARELDLLRTGDLGDVVVGAGPHSAPAAVLTSIVALQNAHPAVRVRLEIGHTRILQRQLMEERIDFFVADIRELVEHENFAMERLGRMGISLMCRSGHPLARRRKLTLADLRSQRFASVHAPADLSTRLANLIVRDERGLLPLASECESVIVLREYALQTDAIILAAPEVMAVELKKGLLHRLRIPELEALADYSALTVMMGMVTLKDRTPTMSMRLLMNLIRKHVS